MTKNLQPCIKATIVHPLASFSSFFFLTFPPNVNTLIFSQDPQKLHPITSSGSGLRSRSHHLSQVQVWTRLSRVSYFPEDDFFFLARSLNSLGTFPASLITTATVTPDFSPLHSEVPCPPASNHIFLIFFQTHRQPPQNSRGF